jgi:hypothetical protein
VVWARCVSWGGGSQNRDPPRPPQAPAVGLEYFNLKKLYRASNLITLSTNWIVLCLQCAFVLTYLSLRLLAHTLTIQVDLIFRSSS